MSYGETIVAKRYTVEVTDRRRGFLYKITEYNTMNEFHEWWGNQTDEYRESYQFWVTDRGNPIIRKLVIIGIVAISAIIGYRVWG